MAHCFFDINESFNFTDAASFKEAFAAGGLGGLIVGVVLAVLVIILLVSLVFYVYMALAWLSIAKKLKYNKPWLAWIPFANLFLLPILAKRNWKWGWFIFIPPVYIILSIFWLWKIYDNLGYPGALSLIIIGLFIQDISGLAIIANLVIFGIVAWSGKKVKKSKGRVKKKGKAKGKKKKR